MFRIGKVTNVDAASGKVKVQYDDGNTSMPLSIVVSDGVYSMPSPGDRVLVAVMDNGSSKGFVLGSFYGGSRTPADESEVGTVSLYEILYRLKRIEDYLGL